MYKKTLGKVLFSSCKETQRGNVNASFKVGDENPSLDPFFLLIKPLLLHGSSISDLRDFHSLLFLVTNLAYIS